MFDSPSPPQPATENRWLHWGGALLILFGVLGLFIGLTRFSGCGGSSSPSSNRRAETASDPSGDQGRDLLDVAFDVMQPDRMGIDAPPDMAVSLLNQWRLAQVEDSPTERFAAPLSDAMRELLNAQLSPETAQRADQDQFSIQDVAHVRNSLLMKAIVTSRIQSSKNVPVLDQVLPVFEFVTRNVELVPENDALPLTPYEILVFGQGTAADRAWVFASLMRQLKLDAVIVKPASAKESAEPTPPWLVGVVWAGEIHLFDPHRSTPVRVTQTTTSDARVPATLSDLAKQPGAANLFWNGSDYQTVRLEVIGESSLWAPRMARLQRLLSGENSVVVAETLLPAPGSSSLVERLSAIGQGRWNREEITLWPYPETQLARFEQLDPSVLQRHWLPFQAPLKMGQDPETKEILIGSPSREQLKTRTTQLLGNLKDAIQSYLLIQLAHKQLPAAAPIPDNLRRMHAQAAEDAFFWTGVSQMGQGDFLAAVNTFSGYLARFPQGGRVEQGRILLARSLAESEQQQQAVEVLAPLTNSSPQFATAEFFRHLWTDSKEQPEPPAEQEAQPAPQPAVAEKPT